jgi:hypothetical protein
MQINIYDYLLLPIYLFLFYFIAFKVAEKYESEFRRYFLISFSLHLLGSILFVLLVNYYYGMGDSLLYYSGGDVFADLYKKDISNLKYLFEPYEKIKSLAERSGYGDRIPASLNNEANATIMRISSLFSFVSFGKYLEISLFFGILSFIGNWKIFQLFNRLNKGKNYYLLAIPILFLPSIWYWGSALGKEAICLFSLGMIMQMLYKLFVRKEYSLINIFSICFFTFLLTLVKSYITIIFFSSILVVLFFNAFKIIKNRLYRAIAIIASISILILMISISPLPSLLQEEAVDSIAQLEFFQDISLNYAEEVKGEIAFSGKLELSPQSILMNAPLVIFSTLFRPFIWDSRKVIMLFSSMETTFMLVVTLIVLWKTRIWGFITHTFNDSFTFFCFTFSIIFAAFIGFTTFNFGTIVRYKIILLPFYYFMLISIYSRYVTEKKRIQLETD